jgi:hypothetical protein
MELANLIPDLLYKHNCVILPGFGGFIANFKASEHQEERFLVSPARKIIAFNQSLVENDGLLISALAKSKKISYAEAENELVAYIGFIQSRLDKYKNFEFKNVGTFYLNSEKNLLFVPYQGLNFLQKSFGLPDVKVKPLFDELPVRTPKGTKPKVVRLKKERATSGVSLFKVAAAAIIILMVGGFGAMYLNENRSLERIANLQLPADQIADSHDASTASIVPIDVSTDSETDDVHPEEAMELEDIENVDNHAVETPTDLVEESIAEPEVIEIQNDDAEHISTQDNTFNDESDGRLEDVLANYKSIMNNRTYFHVIIGEYDSEQDAIHWREAYSNKAYSSTIIDAYKQGKFLISLEHFTKEEHAIAFQREVRKSERKRTWIIEMKTK